MAIGVTLPLSALLSQTLVAFTIEFDNEAERQLHTRTAARPFLVSLVMWYNCLRYVEEEPIAPEQLLRRARTPTNLPGMQRWRYVELDEHGAIRATKLGRLARRIWEPLCGAIEARWSERFGSATVAELRAALEAIATELDPALPDCLPILQYGLRATPRRPLAVDAAVLCLDLPALLARVLHAFALDFEARSELSLALAADVLRVLGADGVRQRDLPHRSGVSKEAIAMATGFLTQRELVIAREEPGARGKRIHLSPAGVRAFDGSAAEIQAVERAWSQGRGAQRVARMRSALRDVLERRDGGGSLLARGLEPAPGGWRTQPPYAARTALMLRDPNAALPHFPMVLHRGGWPDGS
jgi:hypothetical protein